MPFYEFHQNNSGGSFITSDKLAEFVIIEAENSKLANNKAEDLGVYFNGCEDGTDCACCGDRWYPVQDDDFYKSASPLIYGKSPQEAVNQNWCVDKGCMVYYQDGRVETFYKQKDKRGHDRNSV